MYEMLLFHHSIIPVWNMQNGWHCSNSNFEKFPGEYKKQNRDPASDAGSRAIVGENLVFAHPGNTKIGIAVNVIFLLTNRDKNTIL